MGTNHSNYGNVRIQTERISYMAGEVVRGTVIVECHIPIKANELMLIIEGRERVSWRDAKSLNIREEGENILYSDTLEICRFRDGKVPIGRRGYDFELQLKTHMRGSFLEVTQQYRAELSYRLKARVVPPLQKYGILTQSPLLIQQIPSGQNEAILGELEIVPKSCCCGGSGRSLVRIVVEGSTFYPGNEATIDCAIDNSQCSLDIDWISCTLQKKLTMFSESGNQRTFIESLNKATFPGIGAGQSTVDNNFRRFTLRLLGKEAEQTIQSSVSGTIMMCEYFITLRFSMQNLGEQLPFIQSKIQIEGPPLREAADYRPPIGGAAQFDANAGFRNPRVNQMNEGYVPRPGP